MVIYTSRFLEDWMWGRNIGPIILIRPEHKGDAGILAHEETHVRQFWRNPFFGLLYKFSEKHRQAYEVEAYKAQIACGLPPEVAASLLSTNYSLPLSYPEALALLQHG